jgi:acyl carrier protein
MIPSQFVEPFQIVAAAIGSSPEALTIDSAMYRDHGWDSFGHVSVIAALEDACGICVPDGDVMKYRTMKEIVALVTACRQRQKA